MRTKKEWKERLAKAPALSLPVAGYKSIYDRGVTRINKYIERGYIKNESKIIDLGCGIGADAIGLEQWSEWNGNYLGIDAKKYCIGFNRKQHGGDDRFNFEHSNISNRRYNPSGKTKTLSYKIPVSNNSIDFVICSSFFTHTGLLKYARHYLREIWRILNDDGLAWTTWYFGEKTSADMAYTIHNRLEIETILSDGFDIVAITEANKGKQTKIVIRRKR